MEPVLKSLKIKTMRMMVFREIIWLVSGKTEFETQNSAPKFMFLVLGLR